MDQYWERLLRMNARRLIHEVLYGFNSEKAAYCFSRRTNPTEYEVTHLFPIQELEPCFPDILRALQEGKPKIRDEMADVFKHLTKRGYDTSRFIPNMARAVKDRHPNGARLTALETLAAMATSGMDISSVRPSLVALSRISRCDRWNSFRNGRGRRYDFKKMVTQFAGGALASYYLQQADWQSLQDLVATPNTVARFGVTNALYEAANEGHSIEPVIPALKEIVRKKKSGGYASDAIAMHYIRTQNWNEWMQMADSKIHAYTAWDCLKKLCDLPVLPFDFSAIRPILVRLIGSVQHEDVLNHQDERINICQSTAERGEDISPFYPFLTRMLDHPRGGMVGWRAARALTAAYIHRKDWGAIFQLLARSGDVSAGVKQQIADWYMPQYTSIARLETFQQQLESDLHAWFRRPRRMDDRTEESGRRRAGVMMSQLFQQISERKAMLAKTEDGEILTGETIRKPAGAGKRMYAAVRRRN